MQRVVLVFFFFLYCLPQATQAQFNFNRLSFGVGVFNLNHAIVDYESDLIKSRLLGAYSIGYNINPFEAIDIHLQNGNLSGKMVERFGSVATNNYREDTLRSFTNAYTLLSVNYRFSLGRLVKSTDKPFSRTLARISISSGLGLLLNEVNAVRGERMGATIVTTSSTNSDPEAFLPIRISYELRQGDRWRNPSTYFFSYQYLFTASDLIDGFDEGNRKEDTFGMFSVGIRFNFGKKMGFY